jgi:hypothetical protein
LIYQAVEGSNLGRLFTPKVHLYSRHQHGGWTDVVLKEMEAVVGLEKLNVTLDLRDTYAGLEFRPRPKLVNLPTDEPPGDFRPK